MNALLHVLTKTKVQCRSYWYTFKNSMYLRKYYVFQKYVNYEHYTG